MRLLLRMNVILGVVRVINNLQLPSFAEEKILEAQGYRYIAGIDEVGRGALAGPVVAAAAVLPCHLDVLWSNLVRDSKQLTSARRELLFYHIHSVATAIGIGSVGHEVIDAQGIVKATQLAMKLAVDRLSPPAETLLIDFMLLPEVKLPQKGVKGGDSRCFSIACASIVAKVTRDFLMIKLDESYPGYGFARHKGYGTKEHLACLSQLGLSSIHRQSFKPVRDLIRR